MGELRAMGAEGDLRLTWDDDDEASITSARRAYEDLRAKGYASFAVKKSKVEQRGRKVATFDPGMEKIIMVPPMQGG